MIGPPKKETRGAFPHQLHGFSADELFFPLLELTSLIERQLYLSGLHQHRSAVDLADESLDLQLFEIAMNGHDRALKDMRQLGDADYLLVSRKVQDLALPLILDHLDITHNITYNHTKPHR